VVGEGQVFLGLFSWRSGSRSASRGNSQVPGIEKDLRRYRGSRFEGGTHRSIVVEELLSLFVDKAPHTNWSVAFQVWLTNKILETNPDASHASQGLHMGWESGEGWYIVHFLH